MSRSFLSLCFVGALLVGALGLAADRSLGGMDLEIVSVDARTWGVVARDPASGRELRFQTTPDSFVGKRFQADLSRSRAGARVSVSGAPDAQIAGLVAADAFEGAAPEAVSRAPLGEAPPRMPVRPDRRPPPPGSAQGGGQEFEIVSVTRDFVVTARNVESAAQVKLRVDPQAFHGYRLRSEALALRRGDGFAVDAPNEAPIADCCVLLEGGL
ncbi:MAG: hypothetical protein R2991_10360 [Thermoanaerobaculia bacterium]